MPTTVTCPTCARSVIWGPESPFRPFCSDRCRLIDLGDWFEENHRIQGDELDPTDLPQATGENRDE